MCLFNYIGLLPAEDVQIGPNSYRLQCQLFHQIFGNDAGSKQ